MTKSPGDMKDFSPSTAVYRRPSPSSTKRMAEETWRWAGGDLAWQDHLHAGEKGYWWLSIRRASPGFSRISTRRSASSAVISGPDSMTRRLMSSKCQITGATRGDRLLGDDTAHHLPERGVMWCLAMRW